MYIIIFTYICPTTNFKLIVGVDKSYKNRSLGVTTKVRLFHRKYRYNGLADITRSMAHKTPMHRSFVDLVKNTDLSQFATIRRNIRAYFAQFLYDGCAYVFRIAFRVPILYDDIDDTLSKFCEIDIECEESIQYDLFARIALSIFEYFTYQYHEYKHVIKDLKFCGDSGKAFKKNLPEDVVECLSTCILVTGAESCRDYDKCRTSYDDFVNIIAIRQMCEMDDSVKNYIVSNSEKLYTLTCKLDFID